MSRTLEENYGMSATAGAVIGSIASGLIAATLSHPLDTIKTCMQGDVERKRYHNMRQTVRFPCLVSKCSFHRAHHASIYF